jgi:hypothetical protein
MEINIMRCILMFVIAAVISTGFACASQFGDVSSPVSSWSMMPEWLGNPTSRGALVSRDSVEDFAVPEPSKAMKWRREIYPSVIVDQRPYLVFRYRAVSCKPRFGDYILWVGSENPDGEKVILPESLVYDGKFHTYAVDLSKYSMSMVKSICIQVQASELGR